MPSDKIPAESNPESPPLAPHDPPEPAPQAAEWAEPPSLEPPSAEDERHGDDECPE
jgi:hypothetical protein